MGDMALPGSSIPIGKRECQACSVRHCPGAGANPQVMQWGQNQKKQAKKRATTSPESALRALDPKNFSYFLFWESFQMK